MARTGSQQKERKSLALMDFADLELLHVIEDNAGDTTDEIADVLDAEKRSVGTRFAWMRRKGLIDRDTEGGWVLTKRGRVILDNREPALQEIRTLSKRMAKDATAGWVAGREWRRNFN